MQMNTARNHITVPAPIFFLFCSHISIQGQTSGNALTLNSAGSTIHVYFPAPPPDPLKQAIQIWITKAATAVSNYYQRYPVPTVDITVNLRNRPGTGGGHTSGWNE